ncbi:MAG: DUF2357 domain-containing protein [Candidatus Borkfalkiaceae bacterium]|nr:DUF2357 domain-containing protein [Clostridia bacterium]MDY6222570.1 DUF2357 domain-containing protein [Christensenellaceae bacterium]
MNGETNNTNKPIIPDDKGTPTPDVYQTTADSLDNLMREFSYYRRVMKIFNEGEGNVALKKRFLLKAIDEEWITAVENALPSIDVILRNPGRSLVEREELRPVEQTRRVSARSVQHLARHTDLINEIRPDGSVMPSRLLNVFQDDTVLTYENRFINTLISRLYAFVCVRVDAAEKYGADEKQSALSVDRTFTDGEKRGKISLTIEIDEKPEEGEVQKNHVFSSDLWKRAVKVKQLVCSYLDSDFIRQMGRNYVRPPVMRTNLLLKNTDFRNCLTLWEFLESYESAGCRTLIREDIENIPEDCAQEFYKTLAEQYVLFGKYVSNDFDRENMLDERVIDAIKYKIKTEPDPIDERDFTYTDKLPDKTPENTDALEELYDKTDFAVRVAIAADKLLFERKNEGPETKKNPRFLYRYSFLARLILAGDPAQEYYTQIKNYLLSYKKVSARISWNHEQFSAGRKKFARLKMKGKTLFLFLPLDATLQKEKYRLVDVSDRAADGGFLSALRVRSERGVKYAKQLIDAVMAAEGIEKLAVQRHKDYHLPYATREELLTRVPPLIKIVGKKTLKPDAAPCGPSAQGTGEDLNAFPADHAKKPLLRYRYSFLARFIQSDENVQAAYGKIKNRILSYKNVRSATAWSHERFYYGRQTVMTIKIRGKSMFLSFALSLSDYVGTKYRLTDLTKEGKTPVLPVMFKVRSLRSVKYAEDLIDDVMKKYGVKREEKRPVNYSRGYMSTEELLNLPEPLVKKIGDGGVELPFPTAAVQKGGGNEKTEESENAKE